MGRYVLCLVGIVLFICATGIPMQMYVEKKISFHKVFIWGFVYLLAFCQLNYALAAFLQLKFETCYCFFLVFLCGNLIASITIMSRINNKANVFQMIKNLLLGEYQKKYLFTPAFYAKVFVIIVYLLGIFSVTFLWRLGANDDGYYLAKVGEIIKNGKVVLTMTEAANGVFESSSHIRADVSCLPFFYACLSHFFKIHHVVLARLIFPAIIISLYTAVIYSLAEKLFQEKTNRYMFVALTLIFTFFTNGYGIYAETTIAFYTWYGNSILKILIIFFICQIAQVYFELKKISDIRFWIGLLFTNLAILECEIIGIWIIPILYLIYGIPYLIIHRKSLRVITFFYALLSLTPFVLCVPIVLYNYYVVTNGNMGKGTTTSCFEVWQSILCGNIILYVFGIALFVMIIRKKKIEYGLFVLPLFVFILSIGNPFLYDFVTEHITSRTTFQRSFYCLPICIVVTYSIIRFSEKIKGKIKIALCGAVTFMILVLQGGVSFWEDTSIITNIMKFDDQMLEAARTISEVNEENEDIKVVVPYELNNVVRVYDKNIVLVCSDRSSCTEINKDYSYLKLYYDTYEEQDMQICDKAIEQLKSMGTDFVVYRKGMSYPKSLSSMKKIETSKYEIFYLK